mgnify:CR=1 FL=1
MVYVYPMTFSNDTRYKLVDIVSMSITNLRPHFSVWISYYLYKMCPRLSRYDWASLEKQLSSGYNPQSYDYIMLDERDNYIIDGNHRLFLLRLTLNRDTHIPIKLVKGYHVGIWMFKWLERSGGNAYPWTWVRGNKHEDLQMISR